MESRLFSGFKGPETSRTASPLGEELSLHFIVEPVTSRILMTKISRSVQKIIIDLIIWLFNAKAMIEGL